jgi:hypothetical protein
MDRTLRACVAVLAAILAGACSRQASPEATAPPQSTDAPDGIDPAAYYASLVQRFAGDYASCPAAVNAHAEACGEGDVPSPGPTRVLLMLDASGSMAARLGGSTKMDAARSAMTAFVAGLGDDAQVALRVYGHTGANTPAGKPLSCRGTTLVHPFGPLDAARFRAAIASFEPRGWTPIAAALQAAAGDFPADAGGRNVVYLVSDGEETCGGDPVAAARALRESGIAVTVNVIGFGVDAKTAEQLRPIAAAGGGDYLAVDTSAALIDLFNQRIAQAARRFNCAVAGRSQAFNTTVGTHSERFNCLVREASEEFNAVAAQTSRDFAGKAIDGATRDHAIAEARRKREGIIDPARAERDAAVRASRGTRDAAVDRERATRDARLEQARRERPAP